MLANVIVGSILALILGAAGYKTFKDLKGNKCSCGGCSKKDSCNVVQFK